MPAAYSTIPQPAAACHFGCCYMCRCHRVTYTFTSFDGWPALLAVCQHVGLTPWPRYALVSQLVGNGSFPKEGRHPATVAPTSEATNGEFGPQYTEWTALLLSLSEEKSADVFMVHSLLSGLLILMICGQDVCLDVLCSPADRLGHAVTTS